MGPCGINGLQVKVPLESNCVRISRALQNACSGVSRWTFTVDIFSCPPKHHGEIMSGTANNRAVDWYEPTRALVPQYNICDPISPQMKIGGESLQS